MRPRDQQRQRLYDAERAAAYKVGDVFNGRTIANDKLQAWVDEVMSRRAIRTRWPNTRIQVDLKRGGKAYGGHGAIRLPLFARNPWVILHEIAHCLTPRGYAAHGPEYAGVFLFLVRSVLGDDAAAALLAEFRTKGRVVRHNRKAIPSPVKVPTLADMAARKREQSRRRPSRSELEDAAAIIRQAASSGLFGPSSRQPRRHALATARALEAQR